MINSGDLVAIFHSIHRVMKAEKRLKEQGLPILLIPAPRVLAADCGLAIRYAEGDRVAVEEFLASEDLLPEEIFRKNDEQYVMVERRGIKGNEEN